MGAEPPVWLIVLNYKPSQLAVNAARSLDMMCPLTP